MLSGLGMAPRMPFLLLWALVHFESRLGDTKGERNLGEGINWQLGINSYPQSYMKAITNRDLPYSTGRLTQGHVTTYMGNSSYVYCTAIQFTLLYT